MDYISTNPSYTFKIGRNRKLTAVFTSNIPVYTITAAIDPAGAGAVTGAGQYQEGAQATITAAPAEGYTFSGWTENGTTVSTSESYTFTVTGDRSFVAGFSEFVPRLPEGYTELRYIESTGTQHIDTNLIASTSAKVELDIQLTQTQSPARYLLGTAKSIRNQSTGNWVYYEYIWRVVNNSHYAVVDYGTSYKIPQLNGQATLDRLKLTFDVQNKIAYVGEIPTNITVDWSSNMSQSIYLLGCHTGMAGYYSALAKLYSAKLYLGGTIVRDFVPCINPSGAVGLYDIVSGNFYGNAGTGSFTAGPAV